MKLILKTYKSMACDKKLPGEKRAFPDTDWYRLFYQKLYIRRHEKHGQNEDFVHVLCFVHKLSHG